MPEQEYLNKLAACNCCLPHQLNKPIVFAPWVETSFPGPRTLAEKQACRCDCRHLARLICRGKHPLTLSGDEEQELSDAETDTPDDDKKA